MARAAFPASFSFAAALKAVVCAGGECLIGDRAENTEGMACCLFA